MKIYLISVFLLFLTINSANAQPVRLNDNKIPATTVSLTKGPALVLTLTALIEGLYNGSVMVPDTVTVELHNPTSPSVIIESQKGVLDAAGLGTFNFTSAVNGSPYFIVVNYKNAIKTWSATTQTFVSNSLSYDFTNSASKAYGDNLILKGGKWCIYSGDVNQDSGVDILDLSAAYNDNLNGTPGFYSNLPTDINGDTGTDILDLSIIYNNNLRGIGEVVPSGAPPDSLSYEGQTYHTVLIGTHYWLKENMNAGTMIISNDSLQSNNGIIEKYCYNNDTANCTLYGGLYLWNEAMQYNTTERSQGICPSGWHVPTIIELNSLITAVDSIGNALKEIGQGTGEGSGTNTSGFSALMSGYHHPEFGFFDLGVSTDFWSSSEDSETNAKYMYLLSYDSSISLDINNKNYGYSVRCVKD
jgi:uncharacterized protein (TIGR02145 family)